ncbi:hypothetical protein J7K44_01050 [bacterium]|nr:hypothetical protein [bacterium]
MGEVIYIIRCKWCGKFLEALNENEYQELLRQAPSGKVICDECMRPVLRAMEEQGMLMEEQGLVPSQDNSQDKKDN